MSAVASAQTAERPNIVLFIADDMTYTDAAYYGNVDVKTPNIDAFAAEGMRFTQCFTATAMCSPTRQMIYTGMYPAKTGAYPNHAKVRPGTKSVVHYLGDLGYRVGLAGKKHFSPQESFPFEIVSPQTLDISKFREFMTRDPNQPFCLIVASKQPHSPWDQGDASQYDPSKLTLPPYMVDTPETRMRLARYYAEITFLDGQLEHTLYLLDETGQRDETLVMFTSEQGSLFPHNKWTLYDTGMRTQLIARWPGRIEAGSVSDALVQYTDLLPTWLEVAGGDPPTGLDGASFVDVLLGRRTEHREYVYGIHTTRGINESRHPFPIRAIRDDRYKYIWNLMSENPFQNVVTEVNRGGFYDSWRAKAESDSAAKRIVDRYEHRPEVEFYDLDADPFELHNVAALPEHFDRMNTMRAELERWMKSQGDRGIDTELEAWDHQTRPHR